MLIILLPSTLALVTFGKSPCSAISNDLNPSCASATSLSMDGELGVLPFDPLFLPAWYYLVGVVTSSLYAVGNAVISGLLLLNLRTVHRGAARSSPASRLGSPMTALLLFVETGMLLFVGQVVNAILYSFQYESAGIAAFGGLMVMIYVSSSYHWPSMCYGWPRGPINREFQQLRSSCERQWERLMTLMKIRDALLGRIWSSELSQPW